MERLTSYKNIHKREMICRYEDCDICEEYCPHMNEDNCPCLLDILEKLAEYEDLEEQGRLLKLPYSVGDIVFRVNKGARTPIIQMEIIEITLFNVGEDKMSTQIKCRDYTYGGVLHYMFGDIGKIVFLTREEAESALKSRY